MFKERRQSRLRVHKSGVGGRILAESARGDSRRSDIWIWTFRGGLACRSKDRVIA